MGLGLLAGCDSETSSSMTASEQLDAASTTDTPVDSEAPAVPSDLGVLDEGIVDDPSISPQGRILTGVIQRGHSDGVGAEVRFDGMVCAALSPDGATLYISDAFSSTLRALDVESGTVSTLVGAPYESAVFDGPIDAARMQGPRGCEASEDYVWIADGSTLRQIDLSAGEITTLTGQAGALGDVDGGPEEARLGYLTHDLALSLSGEHLFLSDRSNDRIRSFELSTSQLSPWVDGLDGPGGLIEIDRGLLIADTFASRLVLTQGSALEVISSEVGQIQGVTSDGLKAWVGGFDPTLLEVDLDGGTVRTLELNYGQEEAIGGTFSSLVFDPQRRRLIYLDLAQEAVRSISVETGIVETIAGPSSALIDRDGSLEDARFGRLLDVVGTPNGWVVADTDYGKVKLIGEEHVVTLISADPSDDPTVQVGGSVPVGLAFDPVQEALYISDFEEHVIRRYHLGDRSLEVIAGSVNMSGSLDGVGADARFDGPIGLDFGGDGLLYIADGYNRAVRTLNPETGEVNTIATGAVEPFDVLRADDGRVYVVDAYTPALFATEGDRFVPVAGRVDMSGPGDGPEGLLALPFSLTRHPDGGVLIVDSENYRVRYFNAAQGVLSTWVGQFTQRGGWGDRAPRPWETLRLADPTAVAFFEDRVAITMDTALLELTGDPRVEGNDGQ